MPPGRILGSKTAPDGSVYHLVQLEETVRCRRYSTGEDWTLQYLVIKPKLQGLSLGEAMQSSVDPIPVGIGNVLNEGSLRSSTFEWADVEYFAVGYVRQI